MSYCRIPKLAQVIILVFCRCNDPMTFSSISSYLYFMIENFGYETPEMIYPLVSQAVIWLAIGQLLSSILWGYIANKYGRKVSLLMVLTGSLLYSILVGFSSNIYTLLALRFSGGLMNGNVLLVRTIVSDIVATRKEYQSHAFTLLTCATIVGNAVGPLLSGMLADPARKLPEYFGDFGLLLKFPYLLPNLVFIPFSLTAFFLVALFIEETGKSDHLVFPKHADRMLTCGEAIKSWCGLSSSFDPIQPINRGHVNAYGTVEETTEQEPKQVSVSSAFVKPVIITIICDTANYMHCGFYPFLLTMFFATPRMDYTHFGPIMFNGGLGLLPGEIGAIIFGMNIFTFIFQMVLFPAVSRYLGTSMVHRVGLFGYLSYILVPYLTLIPSNNYAMLTVSISFIAMDLGLATSFALPSMEMLISNASPPGTLSIVNGLSQAGQAIGRIIGPIILSQLFSLGVRLNLIGLMWWVLGVMVVAQMVFAKLNLRDWQ